MSEQGFIPDQDKIKQEIDLEVKIGKILKENQGIAFKVEDLNNQLEETIEDNDKLEFAKEKLPVILTLMKKDGKIDSISSDDEVHYIFKKPEIFVQKKPEENVQKKILERQKIDLAPIKQSINNNRTQVTKGVLLIGLLFGLLTMVEGALYEILSTLGFIMIIVSILLEAITGSNQSKQNINYERPIYGFVALTLDLIGLIIMGMLPIRFMYLGSTSMLFGTFLFIIAIISGVGGLYLEKDFRPYAATVGLFFGMLFFAMNLEPLIYCIIYVVA